MALARMRTIKQCYEHFQKEDPDSSISEYYLRCLVKQKRVPVFLSGKKQLINLDVLITYLNSEVNTESLIVEDYGKIRRVPE